MIFELSVLFGESIANPNHVTWRPRNSNSQYRSPESRPSLRRTESESEPPNLATETNADHGTFGAPNSQSPVRIREGLTAKTPRNRGDFSGCDRVRAGSLCNCRLNGGESRIRTLSTPRRIWSESKSPDFATMKFELAVQISRVPPLTEANRKRIRTAQLANREKRGLLRLRGLEPAVSGSDAREPDRQNPAESRELLGVFPGADAKSLQPQTKWRCGQSRANSSLLSIP